MGLSSTASSPAVILGEDDLKTKLNENRVLLSLFKEAVEKIYTQVVGGYSFLLTDYTGTILCIKNNYTFLKEGISLAEESIGTNAIALAIKLREKFNTQPQHHYCSFFGKMHLFAVPVCVKDNLIGSLAVTTIGQPIEKELIIITELLGYQLSREMESVYRYDAKIQISEIDFNNKQLSVLKLLARGLTEKAVAVEIGVSINTVRYHKKAIFRKLDTGNIIDAVVKGLKYGLVSIDEI